MKKKIFIVIAVILLILVVVLGMMFAIDKNRMKNNKPVVFSTWGYSYAPPANEKEIIKEPENYYFKTIDNVTLSLNIPNEWKYEELPPDENNDFYKFALKLYKSAYSKNTVLYFYHNPFGVCGTERTEKKINLNNGTVATVGYYYDEEWSDISFYKLNTNIALINYGLEGDEAQEVLEFIKTIIIK